MWSDGRCVDVPRHGDIVFVAETKDRVDNREVDSVWSGLEEAAKDLRGWLAGDTNHTPWIQDRPQKRVHVRCGVRHADERASVEHLGVGGRRNRQHVPKDGRVGAKWEARNSPETRKSVLSAWMMRPQSLKYSPSACFLGSFEARAVLLICKSWTRGGGGRYESRGDH